MLETKHLGLVTALQVTSEGDTLVIKGEVASEECRSDAKRFALAFDGVFKVRNQLITAAFLEAASNSDLDDFFGTRRPLKDVVLDREFANTKRVERDIELPRAVPIEVVRYPEIEARGEFRSAEWVDLTIDLTNEGKPDLESISLGKFPADWSKIEIAVRLIAPWASKISPEVAFATIMGDGTSQPAHFRCLVSAEYLEESPVQVQAVFSHGTRICGYISRDLRATSAKVKDEPVASAVDDTSHISAELRVMPDVTGPDVSVSIIRSSDRTQHWVWKAFVPGGIVEGTGTVDLAGDGKEFVDGLLKTCPNLQPSRVQRSMDGIGERLWDVAPAAFRTAYLDWQARIGLSFAIQFVTDDPYVPWEMIKPRVSNAQHLFLQHPVARWPLSRAGLRRARFKGGDLLSFVPKYAQHKSLKFAIAEGEWICSELRGLAMSANTNTFLDVLDGKHPRPVGMVHFAGHGQEYSNVNDGGGIEMEDGVVTVTDVHQERVILGKREGTLMVLNACETSAGASLLGMNSGWSAAIADREFGGLIAPLWAVQDEAALSMMQKALPCLLDGTQTLGEALKNARLANCNNSVAAYAYLAHGDVMAKFTT